MSITLPSYTSYYVPNTTPRIPHSVFQKSRYAFVQQRLPKKKNSHGCDYYPIDDLHKINMDLRISAISIGLYARRDTILISLFELIRNKTKLYLDYDDSETIPNDGVLEQLASNLVSLCQAAFLKAFEQPLVATKVFIYHSPNATKVSLHIVIAGYYVASTAQARQFRDIVADLAEEYHIKGSKFDPSCYGAENQCFRVVGCPSFNQQNIKTWKPTPGQESGDEFEIALVSCIDDCEFVELKITATVSPFLSCVAYLDEHYHYASPKAKVIAEILDHVSPQRVYDYDMWLKMGLALKAVFPHDEVDIGLELYHLFSQQSPEKYNPQRVDEVWKVGNGSCTFSTLWFDVCLDDPIWFGEQIAKLYEHQDLDTHFEKICPGGTPLIMKYPCEPVQQSQLDPLPLSGHCIIESYLNIHQTNTLIKSMGPHARILVLSSRKNYRVANNHHRILVTSPESFHRIDTSVPWDLIMIDNSESTLNQLDSTANQDIFAGLIQSAERTIWADNFISQRTIDVVELLGLPYQFISNKQPAPPQRRAISLPHTELILKAIEFLSQKRHIFFAFSTKKAFSRAIEQMQQALPGDLQKCIRCYVGNPSSTMYLNDFSRRNDIWGHYCVVATIDIDSTAKPFDYVFVQFSSAGPLVQDLFQTILQPYTLTENMYYSLSIKRPHPNIFTKRDCILQEFEKLQEYKDNHDWKKVNEIYSHLELNFNQLRYEDLVFKYLEHCGYVHEQDSAPSSSSPPSSSPPPPPPSSSSSSSSASPLPSPSPSSPSSSSSFTTSPVPSPSLSSTTTTPSSPSPSPPPSPPSFPFSSPLPPLLPMTPSALIVANLNTNTPQTLLEELRKAGMLGFLPRLRNLKFISQIQDRRAQQILDLFSQLEIADFTEDTLVPPTAIDKLDMSYLQTTYYSLVGLPFNSKARSTQIQKIKCIRTILASWIGVRFFRNPDGSRKRLASGFMICDCIHYTLPSSLKEACFHLKPHILKFDEETIHTHVFSEVSRDQFIYHEQQTSLIPSIFRSPPAMVRSATSQQLVVSFCIINKEDGIITDTDRFIPDSVQVDIAAINAFYRAHREMYSLFPPVFPYQRLYDRTDLPFELTFIVDPYTQAPFAVPEDLSNGKIVEVDFKIQRTSSSIIF